MSIGVEEEEEDHRNCHQVHIDTKQDACMVEAPALADAADGVDGAPENAERRQDKQQCRFVVWEVGQKVGSDHAGPDQ